MSETIPNKVTHIEELHDSDCPDEVMGQGENPVYRITKKYVPLNR